MMKSIRSGIKPAPAVKMAGITACALACLLWAAGASADQIDPTISSNYPADPSNEDVFTFIADSSFSATELHGYDVDSTQDGESSFLICGTDACSGNTDITSRSFGGDSGYAEVTIYEEGPAGSGYIDPFLRQQHNEQTQQGNNTYETSYNTNNDALQTKNDPSGGIDYDYENMAKDTNAGGQNDGGDFNHAVLWTQELADGETFKLLLDINEAESTSEILLDEMSLWVSTSDMLSLYNPDCVYTETTSTSGSAGCFDDGENAAYSVKVWDMDLDALVAALMLDNSNDSGKAGSGDYDAIFTFETALVNTAIEYIKSTYAYTGDFYFFLENTMGLAEAVSIDGDCRTKPNGDLFKCTGGEVDAGFEEWVMVSMTKPNDVPAPATVLLLMMGGLVLMRQRRLSVTRR